jgi:hypothetical protein
MLVSVGRPSSGACGSKKMVLLAFLLSICHLQNNEEKHGEINDDVARSFAQRSRFNFNRGT